MLKSIMYIVHNYVRIIASMNYHHYSPDKNNQEINCSPTNNDMHLADKFNREVNQQKINKHS